MFHVEGEIDISSSPSEGFEGITPVKWTLAHRNW